LSANYTSASLGQITWLNPISSSQVISGDTYGQVRLHTWTTSTLVTSTLACNSTGVSVVRVSSSNVYAQCGNVGLVVFNNSLRYVNHIGNFGSSVLSFVPLENTSFASSTRPSLFYKKRVINKK
jgi:hypothetical protein